MFMSSNNNKNKDLWNLIHIYGNFMPLPLWDLFHISMSFMPYYTKLYKKVDKLCAKWRSNGKVWKRQMKWVNNLFYKLGTEKCRLRAWSSNARKVKISYHKHKLNPILVHYIYHKNQKGKPGEKDFPLLKKLYHTIFYGHGMCIYRINHRSWVENFISKSKSYLSDMK